MRAVARRARADARQVGSRLRLGHREAADDGPARHLRQPAVPLDVAPRARSAGTSRAPASRTRCRPATRSTRGPRAPRPARAGPSRRTERAPPARGCARRPGGARSRACARSGRPRRGPDARRYLSPNARTSCARRAVRLVEERLAVFIGSRFVRRSLEPRPALLHERREALVEVRAAPSAPPGRSPRGRAPLQAHVRLPVERVLRRGEARGRPAGQRRRQGCRLAGQAPRGGRPGCRARCGAPRPASMKRPSSAARSRGPGPRGAAAGGRSPCPRPPGRPSRTGTRSAPCRPPRAGRQATAMAAPAPATVPLSDATIGLRQRAHGADQVAGQAGELEQARRIAVEQLADDLLHVAAGAERAARRRSAPRRGRTAARPARANVSVSSR